MKKINRKFLAGILAGVLFTGTISYVPVKATSNDTKQTVVDEQVIENIGLVTHEFPDDVHIDISKGILDPKGYNYVDLVDLRTSTEGKNKDNLFALRFESDTIDKMSVKVYAYEVPSDLEIGSYTYEWLLDCNMLDKSDSIKLEYDDFQQETMDYGFSIVDSTKGELVNLVVDKEKYNQMYFECPIKQDNVILIATAEDELGNIVDIAPFFNVSVDDSMISGNNVSTFSEETTVDSDGSFKVDGRTYYEKDHQLWLKEETNQAAFYSRNNTYNPAANDLWPQSSNYPGWFGTKEFTGPLYKGRYDSTAGVYDRHGEGTYSHTTQEYIKKNGKIANGYVQAFTVDNYKNKDDFWCACIDHTAAALEGTYTVDWYYNQVGDWKYWVGIGIISPSCYPNYANNKWGFMNYQRVGIRYREYNPQKPPVNLYLEKKWNDQNNKFGIRPSSVIYDVYYSNDGERTWNYLDWYTLSESNGWKRNIDLTGYSDIVQTTRVRAFERPVNGYSPSKTTTVPNSSEVRGYDTGNANGGIVIQNNLEKGKAKVKKVSSNPTCTDGNPNYSLANAEYGIYKSEPDAEQNVNAIGKLVTDANGDTKEFELDAGTYWIKEIKASKGYGLDRQKHKVVVTAGNTSTITSKEPPKMDPVRVFLQKLDAETGKAHPQGSGTLGGAEYTMKFYPVAPLSDKNADPGKQGYHPQYTWVFATDKDGKCIFDESYKISGPKLPISTSKKSPSLPIGTVTIEETKAPEGYHVEPTVHVRHITEKGIDDGVSAFNEAGGQIKSKERSFDLYVEKKVEGFNVPVKGVTFTHTRPNGQKETFVTDANGKLSIKGLENGIHYIEETALPDHFLGNKDLFLNNKKVQFSVVNGVITADNITNDGSMRFEVKNDNGYLYVLDKAKPFTLSVIKGNDLGYVLKDAEFTLYSDAKCTDVVDTQVSDEKGQLSFSNLQLNKVYYLKETKAPEGYRLLRNADGTPTIKTIEMRSAFKDSNDNGLWVDNEKIDNSSVNISNNNINGTIDIINTHMIKLPKTGNSTTILILIAGMLMMCASPFITSKKKR